MKPKWQKPLNKSDIKHIKKDAGCQSLKQFKLSVETQNKWRRKDPSPQSEPCWECRSIARKLGLHVD